MFNLCAPALIYVAFSLTQVIIDTFKGLYNTALIKIIVMIIITILLNALCQSGMGIISWIIVFIPFIFMSLIVAILLYVFGLDPATGKLSINTDTNNSQQKGGNLVFSSNQSNNSKYMDVSYSEDPVAPSNNSSDPQYE
jgi:hypothetical protein